MSYLFLTPYSLFISFLTAYLVLPSFLTGTWCFVIYRLGCDDDFSDLTTVEVVSFSTAEHATTVYPTTAVVTQTVTTKEEEEESSSVSLTTVEPDMNVAVQSTVKSGKKPVWKAEEGATRLTWLPSSHTYVPD